MAERIPIQPSEVPFRRYEVQDVTFNPTADADTIITHRLNAENVDYEVIGLNLTAAPTTVPVVYRFTGVGARSWSRDFLVLRANVASLSVTLRLSVRR